jgi:hypothetical protein
LTGAVTKADIWHTGPADSPRKKVAELEAGVYRATTEFSALVVSVAVMVPGAVPAPPASA